ncbi:MAG: multifunctional oxoglutarate decarboxylase/oxoglutarate dehydrogenase thiamine pyrophosphate-binding subunit/dihydrolipoyllysine-residue succinyltransferase subunit [Actinobacteria bacterium]|nr:multifunctional oxoglutarate decarboxylase/oxoglutarate dehydrogenase thiamine pyrophosphate-binding subunit/dihydrolipoyllysine-residue succinyltransferase subunit [Actinomycetota bacterium]
MAGGDFEDYGPNSGFFEEMHGRYLENPAAVDETWRAFFEGKTPPAPEPAPASEPAAAAPPAAPPPPAEPPERPEAVPVAVVEPPAPPRPPLLLEGEESSPLRGASARVVENMEASLGVPTATSVRTVPAKLLEVNRTILNNHLARTGGGKISFTHLIAYAVVRALREVPAMNSGFGLADGQPVLVRHEHVNLGLAVDVKKSDGSHNLLVPNIRAADALDFAAFHAAYEELIAKVRSNKLSPDDFAGTTGTVTNPGTIGTEHSVPRLMPGQGFIIGVGAIHFPAEYEGADPHTLAKLGVSKTITLTSTYDHRIIQGAESGEFLAVVHKLLVGEDEFYDEIFKSFTVPYEPARWSVDISEAEEGTAEHDKAVHVQQLINMYRVRGHLIANLDPLGRKDPDTHPELDINHYELTIWDLDREFPVGGLAGQRVMKLRDILGILRNAYARTIGVEYMHIQEPDQKAWIQERIEGVTWEPTDEEKHRILERLNAAEAFERFLHTKYLGHKRFSLEGAESSVPMLDALLSAAADDGVAEAVLGMPHRGRLNILANVVGKSYGQIFREFEGELDPMSAQGSGDVKYHVGATGKHASPAGKELLVTLASNPSHLEAVDPVVEGMVRAKEDERGDQSRTQVLPVLLHGDAAFAGQGVVAETLNLSEVPGYDVGGTVHVVVNNQVGFTTAPEMGRSTVYATDVAKMVQAPIFHVNGDDPEACVRTIRLAFEFRQTFRKDVVVDMICYRRYGHNEADEPGFTQPRMYELIDAHPSPRTRYTDQLVRRGDMTMDEAEQVLEDFKNRLDTAFAETHPSAPPDPEQAAPPDAPRGPLPGGRSAAPVSVATSVAPTVLERIVDRLTSRPDDFAVHPKLERILQAHRVAFDSDQIDWALAETFAFGSLVLEGTPVRVAGQDTRRGTFSQRHGALVDTRTEAEYVPLAHLSDDQGPFMLYDSVLSEFAALGFEYGYSVENEEALVCWEAQFGDFMNGAQVIIDQFIVAAEDKWGQKSSLAMLLPHGFEGQGPEHSSARIERFLALCAEDNLRVVYPSTAAQYFHALRRQALATRRAPLICFTPKKYLRMAHTKSPIEAFTKGEFRYTLDDRATLDRDAVRRVVFCTGKVGHELMDTRDEMGATAAVVRVEQLYPWPEDDIVATLDRYPNAREVWWVQEEPANMGAWGYVRAKLERVLQGRDELRHVAREPSASPATGSATVHDREQAQLLTAAFDGLS